MLVAVCFDRDREVDELVRSRLGRAAVLIGDIDPIDENHAQVAVLGRARCRDVRLKARRQEFFQSRVRHHEIELHARFGAVLDKGFRFR